jgi:hypothetical protein
MWSSRVGASCLSLSREGNVNPLVSNISALFPQPPWNRHEAPAAQLHHPLSLQSDDVGQSSGEGDEQGVGLAGAELS